MVSAVVLVSTNIGEAKQVLQNIKQMEGVEEAHALWGIYDLIVKIKANSIDRLKDLIKLGLRQFAGVSNVLTLMIADSYNG